MKTLLLSAATLFGASFFNVSAQYTNNSLNGPWMTILESPNDTMYFYHYYDGNGVMNYLGAFDGLQDPMGSYAVQSNGDLSGSIPGWGGTFDGQLTSSTQGIMNYYFGPDTITGLDIYQVQQPSALAGTWQGAFYWDSTGATINSSFEIGFQGAVTDVSTFAGTFNGFVFSQNGKVAGYYENGEVDIWGKMQMMGFQDADTISGVFSIDCDCPGGYFEFVRSVDISGIQEASPNNLNAYPNPVNNLLNFDIKANGTYNLKVMNLLGETVMNNNINANKVNNTLDVTELPTGSYIIQLVGEIDSYSSIFIKQ